MLDLEEINNTIQELENGDTTFDTCMKLASLYIVRDNIKTSLQGMIEGELWDIFPAYHKYTEVKKNYQIGNAGEETVLHCLKMVCQELKEFIIALYSNTSMNEEREDIKETLSSVSSQIFV